MCATRTCAGPASATGAPLTLGSIAFAAFLLVEDAVALWFYFTAPAMPALAVQVMMLLQILETVGIAALTYVTWK